MVSSSKYDNIFGSFYKWKHYYAIVFFSPFYNLCTFVKKKKYMLTNNWWMSRLIHPGQAPTLHISAIREPERLAPAPTMRQTDRC